jgi:hypothetical protein
VKTRRAPKPTSKRPLRLATAILLPPLAPQPEECTLPALKRKAAARGMTLQLIGLHRVRAVGVVGFDISLRGPSDLRANEARSWRYHLISLVLDRFPLTPAAVRRRLCRITKPLAGTFAFDGLFRDGKARAARGR